MRLTKVEVPQVIHRREQGRGRRLFDADYIDEGGRAARLFLSKPYIYEGQGKIVSFRG
jgi:hypothetical protein